jgi:GxxExxY protein
LKRQGAKGAKSAKAFRVASKLLPLPSNDVALSAADDEIWYGRPPDKPRREPDAYTDELARRVIGAAIAVHRELGPGYPESVYQLALCQEFLAIGLSFVREKSFKVTYRGADVGRGQLDFLVEDRLVVELKVVESLLPVHRAQVRAYLKALKLDLGLLLNFNTKALRQGIERIVET